MRIIFHWPYCLLNCIHGTAPLFQNTVASQRGSDNTSTTALLSLFEDAASPTVHHDDRLHPAERLSRLSAAHTGQFTGEAAFSMCFFLPGEWPRVSQHLRAICNNFTFWEAKYSHAGAPHSVWMRPQATWCNSEASPLKPALTRVWVKWHRTGALSG